RKKSHRHNAVAYIMQKVLYVLYDDDVLKLYAHFLYSFLHEIRALFYAYDYLVETFFSYLAPPNNIFIIWKRYLTFIQQLIIYYKHNITCLLILNTIFHYL